VLALTLCLPGSLATLFGLVGRKRRRQARRPRNLSLWIMAVLCLTGAAILTGCGTSISDAAAGTYTIPITISGGGGVSQTVSATVIVQ